MDIQVALKFCKDCRLSIQMGFLEEWFCLHAEAARGWDLVDGRRVSAHCDLMRAGDCGRDAKFFEAAEAKELA